MFGKESASESALRTMVLDPPKMRYLHHASPSSAGEVAVKSPGRGFSNSRKRSAIHATKVFLASSQSAMNALRSKVTDRLPLSVRTNRPFISEDLRRQPACCALQSALRRVNTRAGGVRWVGYAFPRDGPIGLSVPSVLRSRSASIAAGPENPMAPAMRTLVRKALRSPFPSPLMSFVNYRCTLRRWREVRPNRVVSSSSCQRNGICLGSGP